MPGDAAEWTLGALYEHFTLLLNEADRRYEQRFDAQEGASRAALATVKEAGDKLAASLDLRFAGVNELRGALNDYIVTLATRVELKSELTTIDSRFVALADKVDVVAASLDRLEGRTAGINAGWLVLGQVAALLAAVVAIAVALVR
jgi:hypothetical protein